MCPAPSAKRRDQGSLRLVGSAFLLEFFEKNSCNNDTSVIIIKMTDVSFILKKGGNEGVS